MLRKLRSNNKTVNTDVMLCRHSSNVLLTEQRVFIHFLKEWKDRSVPFRVGGKAHFNTGAVF